MPETSLQESQLQFVEAVPLPVLVAQCDSRRILLINNRLAELCGRSAGEPAGLDLRALLDFNDSARIEDFLSGGTAQSTQGKFAARLLPKLGKSLPVEITLSALLLNGEACWFGVLSPQQDSFSEQENKRKTDDDYFREFFENANDLIYTMDLDGRIITANRAILDVFGYTLEEMRGLKVTDVVHPNHVSTAKNKIEAKIRRREFTPPYELLCQTRNGSPVWIEVSTRLIVRDGHPFAVQGIARNITERKNSEEILLRATREMEEQKNILDRMIEQNPHAIAFWSADGSFQRCNDAFSQLVGIAPRADYNILRDPQVKNHELYPLFRKAFEGERVILERANYDAGQARSRVVPSKPVWCRVTLFPVMGPTGAIIRVVSYFENMTPQVAAEQERETLERKLIDTEKLQAIGTLAGGVAHDFNNLLTGIMGYLDLLRTMTDERTRPILDKAVVVTNRASELTRQLLAYARKSRMETRVHDLNSTAQEVSALIRQTVDRRIEIRTRILPEAATVKADPGQMNQVLMNLCLNARDTLQEKLDGLPPAESAKLQPRISVEIRLHELTQGVQLDGRHSGMFVRMSVSDNGLGMDEATRQRIFEPFFTTKAIGKGTGLGLATVFGVIKQHGGWVEVNSTPGEGTVFHIYLPYLSEAAQPISNAASSLRLKGGTETILLADDEEMIREIAQEILQNHGYKVILACDGWEALELFQQHQAEVSLVVLDITMPRLSGREIIPKLLAVKPATRIIAMSGYSFSESWPDFHSVGAAAFIQKPYNAVDLVQTVRRVLDTPMTAKPPRIR